MKRHRSLLSYSQKRFSRWRLSTMGSLKSPCKIPTGHNKALECLVFEKIVFFCMHSGNRQNGQTDKRMNRSHKGALTVTSGALIMYNVNSAGDNSSTSHTADGLFIHSRSIQNTPITFSNNLNKSGTMSKIFMCLTHHTERYVLQETLVGR